MQVIPIIICLVLISVVQAALVKIIPKPKLNLLPSQHLRNLEILKHNSPEERRNLSLFPKSYTKYVLISKPIYKIASHKSIVDKTQNPFIKKLNLHDKQNKVVENETEQAIIRTEPMYEKNSVVIPELDTVLLSEETSMEVLEDNSEESNEKQNDHSEEEHKLQNDSNKTKTATAHTENKESPNLIELIYPPISKPIAGGLEDKNIPGFSDVFDSAKNDKEIDTSDWTEFIFINYDDAHKSTKSDKISSEQPEEFFTTEFYEEPEIVRKKRGSNVIEEENLASTVAGYQYTNKDTILNNDVAFKNIHS